MLNNYLKKLGWMARYMHGGENSFNVLYQNRAVGGSLAAFAVGALIVSGPAGWGVALVASAVGGYFSQEGGKWLGKKVFDQYGHKVDLVSVSGVGQLCR